MVSRVARVVNRVMVEGPQAVAVPVARVARVGRGVKEGRAAVVAVDPLSVLP